MSSEAFRIHNSTISKIVPLVCNAIWNELLQEEIKCPKTEQEWLEKANDFNIKWNYPWGLGALDGKHCVTQAFGNSGSLFYNYKKTFSVILLALADANYNCFMLILVV